MKTPANESAHGRDFTHRDIRLNVDNPLCWRALIERLLEDSVMFPLLAFFLTMFVAIARSDSGSRRTRGVKHCRRDPLLSALDVSVAVVMPPSHTWLAARH